MMLDHKDAATFLQVIGTVLADGARTPDRGGTPSIQHLGKLIAVAV